MVSASSALAAADGGEYNSVVSFALALTVFEIQAKEDFALFANQISDKQCQKTHVLRV